MENNIKMHLKKVECDDVDWNEWSFCHSSEFPLLCCCLHYDDGKINRM